MENMDKKKILIICVSIVVFILAVFGIKKVFFDRKNLNDEMALAMRRKPKVQVFKARLADVIQDVKFVGNIRANNQVVLRSEIEGVIKAIHFEEGGNVFKGDLLISMDDSLAIAKRNEIVARLEHAKAEYMRGKSLGQGKYMSESEIFKRKTEMISLEAQAELANIELSKYKIYAPFDGKVGLRDISIGEYVQRGKELLNLVNDNPLEVDFRVPEKEISNINQGEEIIVLLDSTGTEYTGVVKAISPMADKTSHAFMVRGSLDDHDGLYPGQFVDVKVITQENRSAILVPETAVIKSEDGEYVFRIVDNTAFKTDVITGPYQQDGEVEIVSGLVQGEEVVVSGHQQIGDGRQVEVIGSGKNNGGINSVVSDALKNDNSNNKNEKQSTSSDATTEKVAEQKVVDNINTDNAKSSQKNENNESVGLNNADTKENSDQSVGGEQNNNIKSEEVANTDKKSDEKSEIKNNNEERSN